MILASLSDNTIKQYNPCLRQWHQFCQENEIDFYRASVSDVLKFLTKLYNRGCKYGTLNSTKSALALVLGTSIMNDCVIKRFMKGVFKLRTPLPRYNLTWDPENVLNYVGGLFPNESLSFETLSKKLATLLALVTAHRVQTLSLIRISNIKQMSDKIVIHIPDKIKTSAINRSQPMLILPYFSDKPSICPARSLEHYLQKSANKRPNDCDFLFITYKKPFRKVSSQTLSRWMKVTLSESGIDTSIFGAHSTRHAATSAAKRLGVSLDLIRKTAGWSGNSATFARFYNREVATESSESFARTLCGVTPKH